jgi:hypothetical protein
MKTKVIILLLLLLVPVTFANDSIFPLADFNDEPIQAIKVVKGDMLSFNMYGQTHHLFIKELIKDNIKVLFFPNKEEGKSSVATYTLPIKVGRLMAIDVDRDGKKDLSVSLYKITKDDAVIIVRDLREKETATQVPKGMPVGKVVEEVDHTNRNSFLVLALIVIGLFGVLMLKRKKQRDEAYKEDTDSDKDSN